MAERTLGLGQGHEDEILDGRGMWKGVGGRGGIPWRELQKQRRGDQGNGGWGGSGGRGTTTTVTGSILHGGNRGVGRRQSRGFQGELGSESGEGFLVDMSNGFVMEAQGIH